MLSLIDYLMGGFFSFVAGIWTDQMGPAINYLCICSNSEAMSSTRIHYVLPVLWL